MAHIAELIGHTPAEVYGTATFYEMFKFEPVGKYLVNICGTMSCALLGADELMHHAEERLGIKAGGTTPDGLITLEHAECQAACTEAPCLQVNYRYRYRVTHRDVRRAGRRPRAPARLDGEIPPHGTLGRVRQHIPADRGVGAAPTRGRHRRRRRGSRRPQRPEASARRDATGTPIPHAPGFIAGDRPRDRHVALRVRRLATRSTRYLATGGYEGLQGRARPRRRRPVHEEVTHATVLGRGGAGFPAGVKWGLTPQGVWPRYLVVNGDESEPGTYKDRLLMELDPHQLIEGCLIACYAAGLSQCFLYIRGEMAARPGARRRRRSTRPTPPATSARTSSAPTSPSTS